MGDHLRSGTNFDRLAGLGSRSLLRNGDDARRLGGARVGDGTVFGDRGGDGERSCGARWAGPGVNGLVNVGVGMRVYAYSRV